MVNILDISKSDVKEILEAHESEDTLTIILSLQDELEEGYNNDSDAKVNIETKEGQRKLKWNVFCLVEELFELTNEFKNRPWADTEYLVDKDHIMEELADVSFFFLRLINMLGISPEKFLELVVRKYLVNKFRVRSQY